MRTSYRYLPFSILVVEAAFFDPPPVVAADTLGFAAGGASSSESSSTEKGFIVGPSVNSVYQGTDTSGKD